MIAMLAGARIGITSFCLFIEGAICCVVFGGFSSDELAVRIADAKPKVVITASGAKEGSKTIQYVPLLNEALRISSHQPQRCVIFQVWDYLHLTLERRRHRV